MDLFCIFPVMAAIKNNIRKYYEGLEKLKIIDEKGR